MVLNAIFNNIIKCYIAWKFKFCFFLAISLKRSGWRMILLYLTGCFLVSLSGVVGHGSNLITGYERSAIIEATHMVDGYYSWMTTHGRTQTSIATFLISYLKFWMERNRCKPHPLEHWTITFSQNVIRPPKNNACFLQNQLPWRIGIDMRTVYYRRIIVMSQLSTEKPLSYL